MRGESGNGKNGELKFIFIIFTMRRIGRSMSCIQKTTEMRDLNKLVTLGWEKANLFILVKCFDEPPSTTYEARVKGAPTKPSTAALFST